MVTYASTDVASEFEEYQDSNLIEKFACRRARAMPSRRSLSAQRAMHRTPASRRASRRVVAQIGGKDRRRNRHPH